MVTNKTLVEAVDTILKGMDNMFKEERKFNMKTFVTKAELKEELKTLASKEDLKREVSWLHDDINEFNKLQNKVDNYMSSV